MSPRSKWIALVCVLAMVAIGSTTGCASSSAKPAFTVTAQGNATVESTPDKVTVSFGVNKYGRDAKAALAAMSNASQKLINAVEGKGIAKKDIRTTNLNVSPQYRYLSNKPPVIIRYEASESLMVTSKDLLKIGDVIGAATATGASVDSGPTFSLSPEAAANGQALANAMGDAKTRAQAMAKAAGATLGRAVTISEGVQQQPQPQYGAMGLMPREAAYSIKGAPVPTGREQVQASVTVVYELR
jgi:uncharacterized protein